MTKRRTFIVCTTIAAIILLLLTFGARRKPVYVQVYNADEELNRYNREDDKIFDLNFNYVINAAGCEELSIYLAVIVVTSYFSHVEVRSSMRRSFSSEDLKNFGIRRVFLLAQAPNEKYVSQEAIDNEAKRFGDIIQGNFQEAYRNLTYKHIMGLKWASTFCDSAKFVLKMDDDIVIDVRRITTLLNSLKLPSKNYIAGHILTNMDPKRDPANKWYVTRQEYPEDRYPPFMSGWFYITTPEFAKNLTLIANENRYFWIDDVYVTGVLARKLNVRFLNLNKYFAVHTELMQCCLKDLPNIECEYLIGPNGGNNNMFSDFNTLVEECFVKKCPKRRKPLEKTCVLEKAVSIGNGNAVVEPYELRGR